MPKGVYKRHSKREDILAAAAKVYAHYGFEGATIERMAEAAGVSKSLVIEHFGSKQELVKTIVNWVVADNLQKIRAIDTSSGLTLRRREWLIHELIKKDREVWCLILGTALVPSFQFQKRKELTGLFDAALETIRKHSHELLEDTKESAQAYAYTAICLHMGYVVNGAAAHFGHALAAHMDKYLLPEKRDDKNDQRFK